MVKDPFEDIIHDFLKGSRTLFREKYIMKEELTLSTENYPFTDSVDYILT